MMELVRRAIEAIRSERYIFEAREKMGPTGNLDDVVTSADNKAQGLYVKSIQDCFPQCGIVAEEENLVVPCTHPNLVIYFTIDGLDGSRAFVRRQSHGIGTMLALICNEEVISAYVGDVMTREIYGFRPLSSNVYRISGYEIPQLLHINETVPLREQYVLLRDAPSRYSQSLENMVGSAIKIFDGFEVTGGSIGIGVARLWKNEVGAVVLRFDCENPWDWYPIVGISKTLGFTFLRVTGTEMIEEYDPPISGNVVNESHEIIILHKSRIPELGQWCDDHAVRLITQT